MKKKIFLFVILFMTFLTACTKTTETDSEKFRKEYTGVSEYNVFVYKDIDEIIKILENGTGVVYLGFPECPWCQAYVPVLNEIADMEGLETISYYNIYDDRKNNTTEYQKIVSILSDYLPYDDDGNKRVYVPAVIAVADGEIIGYDDETAKDTLGYDTPDEYWTEERVLNLKKKLSVMLSEVVDNKCTECNE